MSDLTLYLPTWLALGSKNIWIRRACDPHFNKRSFYECQDMAELIGKFRHGNWSLGSAFTLGNLCFIQQVDGGDEWLTIKEDVAFESLSCGWIIEHHGEPYLIAMIEAIQRASKEACKRLDYMPANSKDMFKPSAALAVAQLRGDA